MDTSSRETEMGAATEQVPVPTRARARTPGADADVNVVSLLGRVSAAPEQRELPSGDVLVTFRLVVPRPAAGRSGAPPRGASVDTLDCVVWKPALQRRVLRWEGGETVALTGSLRRRFWRGPTGASSRTEVEVDSIRLQ
jgi:single-strand DNA-binding protein